MFVRFACGQAISDLPGAGSGARAVPLTQLWRAPAPKVYKVGVRFCFVDDLYKAESRMRAIYGWS